MPRVPLPGCLLLSLIHIFIVGQDIVLFVQSDHFVRIGLADYKLVIDLFLSLIHIYRAVGSVINRVNRGTTGEVLIETTIILVVMIDVRILLQSRMAYSV